MSAQIPLFERAKPKASESAALTRTLVGDGFDVKALVDNFDVLIAASGGIGYLRKLILELAIRGHLSIRLSSDGSTRKLLDAAHADRLGRQDRGEARQMDELAEVSAAEAPCELPASWSWTRIGLSMNLVNGRAFKPTDWSTSGLPIIRIQNLNNTNAPFNYCSFDVKRKHYVRQGDFLISWSGTPGTSFGAFIWEGPKGVLNQHIFRAEIYGSSYDFGFLRIAINARLDEMIAQAHGAVGLQHITKGKLEALTIPLPPLAEQKRIVAKAEHLMALCDDLEARQTRKRETAVHFTRAALEALTTAEGSAEFSAACKTISENFEVLLGAGDSIGIFRQALIDACVTGQFSPNGKIWPKVRLGNIASETRYGTSRKCDSNAKLVPVLRIPNVVRGSLELEDLKYTSFPPDELADLRLRSGDLLVVRSNGSRDLVGRACVVDVRAEGFAFAGYLIRVRVRQEVALPKWVQFAMGSSSVRKSVEGPARTTSGVHNINTKELLALSISVPHLDEQARSLEIAARLMNLCDNLEASLRLAEDRAAKLAEAVFQELVP